MMRPGISAVGDLSIPCKVSSVEGEIVEQRHPRCERLGYRACHEEPQNLRAPPAGEAVCDG